MPQAFVSTLLESTSGKTITYPGICKLKFDNKKEGVEVPTFNEDELFVNPSQTITDEQRGGQRGRGARLIAARKALAAAGPSEETTAETPINLVKKEFELLDIPDVQEEFLVAEGEEEWNLFADPDDVNDTTPPEEWSDDDDDKSIPQRQPLPPRPTTDKLPGNSSHEFYAEQRRQRAIKRLNDRYDKALSQLGVSDSPSEGGSEKDASSDQSSESDTRSQDTETYENWIHEPLSDYSDSDDSGSDVGAEGPSDYATFSW